MINLKLLVILLMVLLSIIVSGCGNSTAKSGAQEIVTAFEQADVETVNQIVFGINDLVLDDEVSDIFVATNTENGILTELIKLDTITAKKITNNEIIYEIEAPDLSNLFSDIPADEVDNMTEEDLKQYISNYVKNVDTITHTVSVPYILEEGEFVANYKSTEFINAISGGVLDAYKELYQEMLEEYASEMEENE